MLKLQIKWKKMDNYEYNELLKKLFKKLENIEQIIKPEEKKARLEEIENLEKDPSFWQENQEQVKVSREKSKIIALLKHFSEAKKALLDASSLFSLAEDENDEELIKALISEAKELKALILKVELDTLLRGENDDKNALISIHPGAGGTESNDWAKMLLRMYTRFCERQGYKIELLDLQMGDEAGIKDVSFLIKGQNAYGYLKLENGVHRLVRTSPFDSANRRHTSFCSVLVSPEIDDDINISLDEKDLRFDYYRASGAGGQHVNKTESAVRITHLPTNTVVQCQNDRSQHKNKASALKMLKSRLYELELREKQEKAGKVEKSDIAWGHQIRSYVLFPYQQIKDHRSNIGYHNVTAILDGDIKNILEESLVFAKQD